MFLFDPIKSEKPRFHAGFSDVYTKYTENDQDIFSDNLVFSFIEDDSPQNYFSSSNENIFSVSDYFKRGENTLTFENNSSDKANVGTSNSSYYLFTMSLVEIVDYEKIKKKVKEKNELPIIVRCVIPFPVGNIQEELDITDVYSGTDMVEIPCRGWKCAHIKCFDLKNFLQVQKIAKKFVCPYCNQKVGLIYYDGRIKKIIEEIRKESDHNLYIYYINNDYRIIKEKKKSLPNSQINVINIEEEISDIDNGENYEMDSNNDIEIQIEQPPEGEDKSNLEINLVEEEMNKDFIQKKHKNETSPYEIIDISEDNENEKKEKAINKLYNKLISNYSYCFIYKEDIELVLNKDNI